MVVRSTLLSLFVFFCLWLQVNMLVNKSRDCTYEHISAFTVSSVGGEFGKAEKHRQVKTTSNLLPMAGRVKSDRFCPYHRLSPHWKYRHSAKKIVEKKPHHEHIGIAPFGKEDVLLLFGEKAHNMNIQHSPQHTTIFAHRHTWLAEYKLHFLDKFPANFSTHSVQLFKYTLH